MVKLINQQKSEKLKGHMCSGLVYMVGECYQQYSGPPFRHSKVFKRHPLNKAQQSLSLVARMAKIQSLFGHLFARLVIS